MKYYCILAGIIIVLVCGFASSLSSCSSRSRITRNDAVNDSADIKKRSLSFSQSSGKEKGGTEPPAMEFTFNLNQILQDNATSTDSMFAPPKEGSNGLWIAAGIVLLNLAAFVLLMRYAKNSKPS